MSTFVPGPSWGSPEPGIYERVTDPLETMYANLAELGAPLQREQWAITSALKLSFPPRISDPVPYLQRAWAAVRAANPVIGAKLSAADNDGRRVMTVVSKDEESWVENTFFIQADVANAKELSAELNMNTCGMHWVPSSSEVLFHISHWKLDGRGSQYLWSNFLDHLARFLREGLDSTNAQVQPLLSRSLADLIRAPMDTESAPPYIEDAADKLLGIIVEGMPSVGPPLKPGADAPDVLPGTTKRCAITLEESTTSAIVAACRAKGISVSAMAHTAVIRAIAKLPQHHLSKHVSTLVAVDMRPYLPAPFNAVSNSAGAYASAHPLLITNVATKSFDEIAQEAAAVYKLDFGNLMPDDRGQPLGLAKITGSFARKFLALMTTPPPPELPPMTTPSVSSLGVLEKYISREYDCGDGAVLAVEEFFLMSEQLGKDMWAHIFTFRDRLTLPMVFNGSYHDEEAVEKVLQDVRSELLVGLGLVD